MSSKKSITPTMYCQRVDCNLPTSWQVNILFLAPKEAEQYGLPLRGELSLGLCEEHKAEATVENIVSDEGWTVICKVFSNLGLLEPNRSQIKLDFVPTPWKAEA